MNSKFTEQFGRELRDQQGAEPGVVVNSVEQIQTRTGGQCTKIKRDGSRCHAPTVTGLQFCFFHNPGAAAERAAASKRGGEKTRAAVLPSDTPDAPLSSAAELNALLARTINQLLRGQLDPKIANAVGYLLTVMMKAADLGKVERRIAALERALKEKQSEVSLFEPDEFGGA